MVETPNSFCRDRACSMIRLPLALSRPARQSGDHGLGVPAHGEHAVLVEIVPPRSDMDVDAVKAFVLLP